MADDASPAWGYRKGKDGLESKIFEDGKLPKGWVDNPGKVKLDDDK